MRIVELQTSSGSHALARHADSVGQGSASVSIEVTRAKPNHLFLAYTVADPSGDLHLPPITSPSRSDELWRHTCCEAFLRLPSGAYHEFNFAPSTQWAAYCFDGYRSGMTAPEQALVPRITRQTSPYGFKLRVELDLGWISELPPAAPWRLGVSAVLERTDGGISYWALAHPPGKPDFHHPDSFVLELPPA